MQALAWLVDGAERVLTLDMPRSIVYGTAQRCQEVFVASSDPATLTANDYPGIVSFAARCDAIPIQPCSFSAILINSPLDPSVDQRQAHGQLSRALVPGGWVAGWTITRDDSVPWVQRLRTVLQSADPSAMTQPAPTAEPVLHSNYFPRHEQHEFRLWSPITPDSLYASVMRMPAVAELSSVERSYLLDQVNEIFSNAAGYGELRLPYQIYCWKAFVDHEELTQPIQFSDGGLRIYL